MVVIILPVVPVVTCAFEMERRFAEIGLLLPFTVAVRLIAKSPLVVAIHPHGTISIESINRTAGTVNWDQVMVNTKSIPLGIAV